MPAKSINNLAKNVTLLSIAACPHNAFSQHTEYMKPFVPTLLPLEKIDWASHVSKMGEANRALAHYDGLLQGIPEPSVLLSPLTTHEAVLSSQIEGTRATLGEVLKFDAGEDVHEEGRKQDIDEIVNYRSALRFAEKALLERPFTISFMKELHALLLDSVRGRNKTPGKVRETQNWIGSPGSTIEQAAFIPPPPSMLNDFLENWEKFYASEQPDPMVQLSIIHAQFEILHPFNDGNGRLGRMLIPLFLHGRGILSSPMFYLSSYLEAHRDAYIENLRQIGTSEDSWDRWISFFLSAIIYQAKENTEKVHKIMKLYSDMKEEILRLTNSKYSIPILDEIFSKPVFNTNALLATESAPSKPILLKILKVLIDANRISFLSKGRGPIPARYIFPELINICEGRRLFH